MIPEPRAERLLSGARPTMWAGQRRVTPARAQASTPRADQNSSRCIAHGQGRSPGPAQGIPGIAPPGQLRDNTEVAWRLRCYRRVGGLWLAGGSVENFCLHNPVAKACQVLAANYLGRTRPGAARIKQASNTPPDMPVRELLGVWPPVRGLVNGRRPRSGVTLHCSPLERPGCGVRITHAAMPGLLRCNAMLAVAWWHGEWADCTAIAADVCAPHKAGHPERRLSGAGKVSGRAGAGPPRRPFPRCPAWSIPRRRPGRPRSAGRGRTRHRYRGVL